MHITMMVTQRRNILHKNVIIKLGFCLDEIQRTMKYQKLKKGLRRKIPRESTRKIWVTLKCISVQIYTHLLYLLLRIQGMIWAELKAWQSKEESHFNQSFLKLLNWAYSIAKITHVWLQYKMHVEYPRKHKS